MEDDNFSRIEPTEEIINQLFSQETGSFMKRSPEIIFITNAHLGIPSGDNWVVLWKERSVIENRVSYENRLIVYSLSDKIENKFDLGYGIINPSEETNFDIMKDIPGIHITETGLSIFDINKDGIEEIIGYDFTGLGDYIVIYAYDAGENKMVDLCHDIYFEIVDKYNGPAPLEFVHYGETDGFKVYSRYKQNFPVANLINNSFAWYFCAWDYWEEKYTVIVEYLADETGRELELEFDIYKYPQEHFMERIQYYLSNMEGLESFREINSRIEDGRSFMTTIHNGPQDILYERIFDFDQDGKMIIKD
jgi:hypothetical protein